MQFAEKKPRGNLALLLAAASSFFTLLYSPHSCKTRHTTPQALDYPPTTATMALSSREQDIQMMLAAKCHIGTKNCDFQMQRYIFRRSPADATHIIDLGKTWDKLQLAARIICAIENPQDVVVLSARPYGQRAVLKFSQYTGTKALVGRFTPGMRVGAVV